MIIIIEYVRLGWTGEHLLCYMLLGISLVDLQTITWPTQNCQQKLTFMVYQDIISKMLILFDNIL